MPKCHLCNDFQRSAHQFRLAFDCSQKELIQSAKGGCIICSFLLEGFQHFEPKLGVLQDHDRIHVWGADVDGGGAVEMGVFSGGALRLRLEFFNTKGKRSVLRGARTLLFNTKGKTSVLQGARMMPTIPGDTRAPASIEWAKQRLQECIDSHASCGQESIPELPTRVLDLGSGTDDMMNIKLIRTQSLDARYACLSHRWSRPAALKTVKSNYVSHTKGLGWDVLPKTFIDAITIVRDLGVRYLWIDSLCIIQDDEDDKSHEIAKMSSIYTNSYITIAATHAESSMHGCYSTRSFHHQDYRLSSSKQHHASTVKTDLYVREKIAHIGEEGALTPLLKRGWVCQERLLSPRVLHFCEKELVWECRESSSCQCSCFNPPVHFKKKYMDVFRPSMPIMDCDASKKNFSLTSDAYLEMDEEDRVRCLVLPAAWAQWLGTDRLSTDSSSFRFESGIHYISPPKLHDGAIRRWRYIVSDYTGMDLTERRDRLPAIAGVASQFERLLNGRYLAGLWENALPGDLLWRMDRSGQYSPQYRAPSWSWASIEGKVKYYRMTSYHPEFSIVSAFCDPLSEVNRFGEVASGSLKINATVANLEFSLDSSKDEARSRRPMKVDFMGDTALFIPDCELTMSTAPLHVQAQGLNHTRYNFLCIGDFNVERNDAIVIESRSASETSLATSLVVQEVDEGRYKRVGILERYRVHRPKYFNDLRDNVDSRDIGVYVKILYTELSSISYKNSQAKTVWRYVPGLVLI
ncbi:hypothetical protein AG0111_0g9498 [Alternaria gaisen]|uniref:Uncharacterized protein n=1 Tax=Alternaria gaisen TaxID=167740 RepID=A0ACB6FCF7_9PLEO|nr:hypothetical protein AG0111_0g9498 [Alternaria gaisen]